MIGAGAAFGTKPGADPGLLRGSEPPPDAENFPPGAFVRFRNVLFSSSSKKERTLLHLPSVSHKKHQINKMG